MIDKMSFNSPNIQTTDGSNLRFAIVASRYNEVLVDTLVQHVTATLTAANVPVPAIERVPGAAGGGIQRVARHRRKPPVLMRSTGRPVLWIGKSLNQKL